MKSPVKLLLFALILASACKEDYYKWNMYLENKSNQSVHVKLTSSTDSISKSIYLKPNEEVLINSGGAMGRSLSPYPLEINVSIFQYDSCFVIFNDTVALIYTYTENFERNILLGNTYTRIDGSSSRKYTHNNYRYTITEQDFLDAEPL
jgi:hypothetical protein